jgi:transposase-like protein
MLDNIGVQLEANPNTSVRSLARQFGLSKTTAYKARKLLKEWPQDGKACGR